MLLIPATSVLDARCCWLCLLQVLITKLRSATSVETQQSRKATKALLVLIPLLGMTYVLTLAAPPDGATGAAVYAAVRACLLSTQVSGSVYRHFVWRVGKVTK